LFVVKLKVWAKDRLDIIRDPACEFEHCVTPLIVSYRMVLSLLVKSLKIINEPKNLWPKKKFGVTGRHSKLPIVLFPEFVRVSANSHEICFDGPVDREPLVKKLLLHLLSLKIVLHQGCANRNRRSNERPKGLKVIKETPVLRRRHLDLHDNWLC
jgi:hypothetical protein